MECKISFQCIENQDKLTKLQQQNKELQGKLNQVLQVCKGHEDLMWSAKIISIILNCDFRDAKEVLKNYQTKETACHEKKSQQVQTT